MQDIGSKYKTQIPSLTENADIQTALRVYHYGAASEPGTLVTDSIAGHLETLENTKVDIVPIQIVSGPQNNLNLKVTTGFYSIATNAVASAGSNYPAGATAGVLQVVNDGSGIVYQTYLMSGTPPKMLWRGYYAGAWSSWTQASDTSHSHAEFTTLAGQIATKEAIITGAATTITSANLDTEKVVVTDSTGKIAASSIITTTELGYLNNVSSNVQTQIDGKPTTVNGKNASANLLTGTRQVVIARPNPANTAVPDATFTPTEGDIWFW